MKQVLNQIENKYRKCYQNWLGLLPQFDSS
jgi:hypothetical protein